jgi:hypothetical protein
MTIINGIEIDNIDYKLNEIKYAIKNNDPIEEKLNVIIVISNPCQYATRYILCKEFIKRIEEEEENVNLYIVELIYPKQKFIITNKNNKNHLQIKTQTPIWHKENMINLGVKNLLPKSWKAFAWIDADIEFENPDWALDTLKILNGCKDIVQPWSHAVDMDYDKLNLNIFNGFGYSFSKQNSYTIKGKNYWHPGFAWAITRKAYEKIGGLYDKGVLGSGDNMMSLSFINKVENTMKIDYSEDYKNSIYEFQKKAKNIRLGYVPGVIRHYYHGSKKDRNYTNRWEILIKHNFSPTEHLRYDNNGILIPSENFSEEFKKDILNYFKERKEDDIPYNLNNL